MVPLRAGPLRMSFDPSSGFLRHLTLGSREVIRGIYGAVRDANWNTVPPFLSQVVIHDIDDPPAPSFSIAFDARCRDDCIDFSWQGTITGSSDGTVRYAFRGTARSAFRKNRIGLCLLHPIVECAGAPCRVEHSNGSSTEACFPQLIAPHQPFRDVRTISHIVQRGLWARVQFSGDVFEMEDQRNWTDASFKTYSTPLDLPFPVALEPGDSVSQEIVLSLSAEFPDPLANPGASPALSPPATLDLDWDRARPRCSLGTAIPTAGPDLSEAALESLAHLRPDHLRCDLRFSQKQWPARLRQSLAVAESVDARLHLALHLTRRAPEDIAALLEALGQARDRVALWLVFCAGQKTSDPETVELAARLLPLRDACSIPLVAGTDAWFAEWNRQPPPPDATALPCFSITPQVHAFDDLSLIETLQAQRCTVDSARALYPRPVVISPITLLPRFNPNATQAEIPSEPPADPRQSQPFAAAWTAGSLARLTTHPHVHSLTYYESAGSRGLTDARGHPYPVYHVLQEVLRAGTVCESRCSHPLSGDALGLTAEDGRRRVLIANFTARETAFSVCAGGPVGEVRRLDPIRGFVPTPGPARQNGDPLEIPVPPASAALFDLL
ncbi:MAG TPA: hypothetical protein VMN36_17905 [Verrucomicrobiales bacterium]|nr:hypothetical protein [Verrucomicrobiales bacterium]